MITNLRMELFEALDQILTVCVQVVDQVLAGDGVGWLKLGKLRKLLEDENYRVILLSKLVSSMEVKVTPDDHIQDVVSSLQLVPSIAARVTKLSVAVRDQAGLQGDAEAAAGGGGRPRAQPRQLRPRRPRLRLPPARDLPHSLLEPRPPGQRRPRPRRRHRQQLLGRVAVRQQGAAGPGEL